LELLWYKTKLLVARLLSPIARFLGFLDDEITD